MLTSGQIDSASELKIYGGDGNVANNYNLTSVAPRFTGIITSYNITEDRQDTTDNYTVTLNASSFKVVLENRIAGRKTNQNSWQVFDPTDTSMINVYSLSGYSFDFGRKVNTPATNPSAATQTQQTQTQFEGPGGRD